MWTYWGEKERIDTLKIEEEWIHLSPLQDQDIIILQLGHYARWVEIRGDGFVGLPSILLLCFLVLLCSSQINEKFLPCQINFQTNPVRSLGFKWCKMPLNMNHYSRWYIWFLRVKLKHNTTQQNKNRAIQQTRNKKIKKNRLHSVQYPENRESNHPWSNHPWSKNENLIFLVPKKKIKNFKCKI